MSLVVQVKGNAFVKEAPTFRKFYLLEKSETRVHIIVVNSTKEVPYCDCFHTEDEWIVASPDPSSQPKIESCAVRMTAGLVWVKSTMLKSIITKTTESETKANYEQFVEQMIKEKKKLFVEKKKPTSSKKHNFKVESSRKMQKIAQRIAEKKREGSDANKKKEREEQYNNLDLKEKAVFII